MSHGRQYRPIEDLANSQFSLQAKLTRAEVIATVLYIGPMVRSNPKRFPLFVPMISLIQCFLG